MNTISLQSIALSKIDLPFKTPFKTAHGEVSSRPLIILKLTSTCNTTVYSECSALNQPSYHPETTETAEQTLLTHLIPSVLNRPLALNTLSSELFHLSPSSPFAIASIEMGVWAMAAALSNQSLSSILGDITFPTPSGWVIGLSSKQTMRKMIRLADSHNIQKLKFKITPQTLATIIELIQSEQLCDRFSFIALDANESFDESTIHMLSQLNPLPISYIEQPLPRSNTELLRNITQYTMIPVVLDESLQISTSDALSNPSCCGIVLKPALLGGYQPSLDLIKDAKRFGKQVILGGLYESGLGKGYLLSLAKVLETTWPSDIAPFTRFNESKKDHSWSTNEKGYINTPSQRFYCDEPTHCSF